MKAFEYASPSSVEEAIAALAVEGGAAALAGGIDLLSLMKDGVESPKRVVNLKGIKALKGIIYDSRKGLQIGALTTIEELLADRRVQSEYPALAQAAQGVRSAQIQAVGTVGGDLCQRPRCWYYRSGYGLLGIYNGKSMAPEGDNRYHAILGNAGPAYFVSPSSFAPALITLDAIVQIAGPKGKRDLPVQQFFRIPTKEGEKEHSLDSSEIVTGVLVPPAAKIKNAIYEVHQKQSLDWPLVAAAVALEMDGRVVRKARVALGHVAPIPWPAPAAEQVLAGKPVTESLAEQAGQAAVEGARPLSGNAYKVRLGRVAVKRAVLRAAGMEV